MTSAIDTVLNYHERTKHYLDHYLKPNIVLPFVAEVIFVQKSLFDSKTKIGQAHILRVIRKAHPA